MTIIPDVDAELLAFRLLEAATRNVLLAGRAYAAVTHGNLSGDAYLHREELRELFRDALAALDLVVEEHGLKIAG